MTEEQRVRSTLMTKFDLRQIRKSRQALLFFPARVKRSEKAKSS
jgi:hypothetical protein